MPKKKIPEIRYRASRICRVLGNLTAYEILYLLKGSKKKPSEIPKIMRLSISKVSHVLKSLRQLDLVRYDVQFQDRYYWIKEEAIGDVMLMLENLVKKLKIIEVFSYLVN